MAIGATDYSTTQAVRLRGAKALDLAPGFGSAESTSLVQWRIEAHVTETLFENTDLGIS